MSKYDHIKQQAYKANMQLPALGLVLFTFGNVSAADRDLGVFAIKPSGVPYKELSPEKMVIVDFNGNTVEGICVLHPIHYTHAVIYKHFETIGGICTYTFNLCNSMGAKLERYSDLWNNTC